MLHVILCVDLEPDRPLFGGNQHDRYRRKFTWYGLNEVRNCVHESRFIKDSSGHSPKLTGFARADEGVRAATGDVAFIFRTFKQTLKLLDEIGLHLHLERWNGSRWHIETEDANWLKKSIYDTLNAAKELGFHVKSCRIGYNFHNTLTMNILAELGIKTDLTALPGLRSQLSLLDRAKNLYSPDITVRFDWSNVPNRPYYPSAIHFKEKTKNGPLLEIPVSVYEGRTWNPTRRINYNKKIIDHSIERANVSNCFLVGAFHCDDLCFYKLNVLERGLLKGLGKFGSIQNFVINMKYIMMRTQSLGCKFNFITPSEAVKIINSPSKNASA